MGTSAYMEIDALRRLAGEGDTLTGAFLQVDRALPQDRSTDGLKDTPAVAGVGLKRTAIESFDKTLADTFYVMIFFNLLFSSVIAGGVVYNAARVSLSERSRELASLRVLGFTRGEISFILLGELAVVTLMAIPVGLVMGYAVRRPARRRVQHRAVSVSAGRQRRGRSRTRRRRSSWRRRCPAWRFDGAGSSGSGRGPEDA